MKPLRRHRDRPLPCSAADADRGRCRALLALLALLIAVLAGCAGKQQTSRSEFWLEAAADPQIQLDPPLLLAGEVTQVALRGVLVDHRAAFETVADYSLEVMDDDGVTTVIHYALGAGRRIPVERGELVWVTVWQRRRAPLGAVRALRVEVWRPSDLIRGRRLLAMVQANELIPEAAVPAELRRVGPSNEIGYQTAERIGGACVRAVVHRQFEQNAGDAAGPQSNVARRTLPAGARFEVREGIDAFDLLLIDHREVIGGDCPDELGSYWAWSAVYVPPPPGTRSAVALRPGDAAGGAANPGLQKIAPIQGNALPPLRPTP